MKTLLTLFTFTFLLFTLKAQGTWSSRSPLPYPDSAMEQGIPGFSIGNYGYVGLGDTYYAGNPSPDLLQFNPATNSWAKKATFPGKARVAPACFVIGNYAYVVCGSIDNGRACVNECWQYDATNDTWTQKANFPGGARTYAVGFAIDSLGYVGTGANELQDFYKDFYAYHPSTDTWTRIADFGGIARDCDGGFSVNGLGYVCMGKDSLGKIYKDMWEYDPKYNTWTQKASNPYPMNLISGFVICDNIYLGGDSTGGFSNFRGFWKYNTVTDTWTQEADMPGTRRIEGAAFSIGDTGYDGFGLDTTFANRNVFYRFYGNDSCNLTTTGYSAISNIFQNITIYPNPFSDECFIKLPIISNAKTIFSIYDIQGNKIKENVMASNPDDMYTLKRNGLSDGVYILMIQCNNQTFHKKLIIIN